MGSAQIRPDKAAHAYLSQTAKVLVALDADRAGAKEAWQWWLTHYSRAVRWPVVLGKEIGNPARLRAAR